MIRISLLACAAVLPLSAKAEVAPLRIAATAKNP